MDPVNVLVKFEVRSFIRSGDNSGYLKTLSSPVQGHPRSLILVPIESAYASYGSYLALFRTYCRFFCAPE